MFHYYLLYLTVGLNTVWRRELLETVKRCTCVLVLHVVLYTSKFTSCPDDDAELERNTYPRLPAVPASSTSLKAS